MFLIVFFIAIISIFFNKRNALVVWILSSLLIPSFVRMLPVPLSYELAMVFFLLVWSIFNYEVQHDETLKKGLRWTLFFSFYYIIIRVVFSFLGSFFSYSEILQKAYINCLFLAVSVFTVWRLSDSQSISKAYKIVCIVLLGVCIYGVFTYIIGSNPYIDILSRFAGGNKNLSEVSAVYAEEVRGGLKSRISVLTYNPLQYAILLNAFIFIPIYLYFKEKKKIYMVIIGLMFLNMFLTGSRGPLISLLVSCSFFFVKYQNLRGKIIFFVSIVSAVGLLLVLPGLDSYASYIKSILFIFSEKASEAAEIQGSSISGRLGQLEGVLSIVAGAKSEWRTILFGFGDGYTNYFLETYGTNFDGVGAFEGVLLSSLLNYGVCGFLLVDVFPWFFVLYCIKYSRRHNYITKRDSYLLYSMLLTHVIFSFLVGSVYYLIYFAILFCIMKAMMMEQTKVRKIQMVKCLLKKQSYEMC